MLRWWSLSIPICIHSARFKGVAFGRVVGFSTIWCSSHDNKWISSYRTHVTYCWVKVQLRCMAKLWGSSNSTQWIWLLDGFGNFFLLFGYRLWVVKIVIQVPHLASRIAKPSRAPKWTFSFWINKLISKPSQLCLLLNLRWSAYIWCTWSNLMVMHVLWCPLFTTSLAINMLYDY